LRELRTWLICVLGCELRKKIVGIKVERPRERGDGIRLSRIATRAGIFIGLVVLDESGVDWR
jgi:hypothetical protein